MTPAADPDRQQILAVAQEESDAIAAADAERYFAILDEDAVFLPPNLAALSGARLRTWLGDFLNQVAVEVLQTADGETGIAGDLAFHEYTCSWRTRPRAGGSAAVAHFKGLHILRRMPGGNWKLMRNIWNLNPAPAP